jgi:hypothetical protein
MKKTVFFFLILVLLGTMGVTGLAWAQVQKLPTQPQPYKPIPHSPKLLPHESKTVFVTSQTYTGNLGGPTGADQKCQQLANAAGLSGTYKAWISGVGPQGLIGPDTSFTHSTVPYLRVDGVVIANNWTSLNTSPYLLNPIFIDERGQIIPTISYGVWTGISPKTGPGQVGFFNNGSQLTCNNWSSSGGLPNLAIIGSIYVDNKHRESWTMIDANSCDHLNHLYCFQQ